MFRPVRRKKKEISMEAVKQLLHTERRGVFAVNGDDGYPYAIPVNFFYDEEANQIYFHGARAGHKIDSIQYKSVRLKKSNCKEVHLCCMK